VKNVSTAGSQATTVADAVAETDAHVGTRNRVARLILADGPATAADLAKRLALTPAAIRRHLDALLAEGLIEASEQRVYGPQGRGRGRPAKVFSLTDAGRGVFYQAYDTLALDALSYLSAQCGEDAITGFARSRVTALEERYQESIQAAPAEERVNLLADALTAEGYAACSREAGSAPVTGTQLCQHHCPVAHVAEQYPQLCEAETEVFSRLLGTHVQRLATIAHGDGVCTTFIPDSTAQPTNSTSTTSANEARGGKSA
jgi:predicted ArsR family transcriptional regulator